MVTTASSPKPGSCTHTSRSPTPRTAALERELVDLYAANDTEPAGGPSCYELEYLLVRMHTPAPGR